MKTGDDLLVSTLGITRKEIKHHNDKGRVCKALAQSFKEKAVIDEDPLSTQPKYLKNLIQIEIQHNIITLYDEEKQHTIIVIKPRLEIG